MFLAALSFAVFMLVGFGALDEIFVNSGVAFAALLGYARVCGPKSGGINLLYAITMAELTSFTAGTSDWSAVTTVSSAPFKKYEFKQDECELKVMTKIENGSAMTEVLLEFHIEKMSKESSLSIDDLASNADCGICYIAVDNNGNNWVVGYSSAHLKERPARFLSSEGTTGKLLSDKNGDTVTVQAFSQTRPWKFTGTIPV